MPFVCKTPSCSGARHQGKGFCAACYYRAFRSAAASPELRAKDNKTQQVRKQERQVADPSYLPSLRAVRMRIHAEKQATDPVYRQTRNDANRARRTGFTPELWAVCNALQRGRCAICPCALSYGPRSNSSACADHRETLNGAPCAQGTKGSTRHPRGVLCHACNVILGLYEAHQRPSGLRIAEYEYYLAHPPVSRLAMIQNVYPLGVTADVL